VYLPQGPAEVQFEMITDARTIRLAARKQGRYALPYETIRVVTPPGERHRASRRSSESARAAIKPHSAARPGVFRGTKT
jgi:hypothetical protein